MTTTAISTLFFAVIRQQTKYQPSAHCFRPLQGSSLEREIGRTLFLEGHEALPCKARPDFDIVLLRQK